MQGEANLKKKAGDSLLKEVVSLLCSSHTTPIRFRLPMNLLETVWKLPYPLETTPLIMASAYVPETRPECMGLLTVAHIIWRYV